MCEVIVLFDGYSKNLDDGKMDANCTCTLIKGPKLIIVDTMTAWDREKLIKALAQYNIEPRNIDYVVCTHSHSDHIGNNNLFTNAEHIVGLTVQNRTIFYENSEISNEGYKLCPGVKVMATPGHTREDVSVLVETIMSGEVKLLAITGDLFEKVEDIEKPHIWKSLGTPELLKTQSIMRSRIIDVADFIIPGHGSMFRVTDTMREIVKNQVIQYPLYQRGNPQLRIFLPNFWMKLIEPRSKQPSNIVEFHCSMQMTKSDIKNYLEKIYNIDIISVRTKIEMGRFKRERLQNSIVKEDDRKLAFVILPKDQSFVFPDMFSNVKDDIDEETLATAKKDMQDFLRPNKAPGLPSWFRI